ncbi:NUDIX hydrolase [Sphingorhabdus arenilitoris]|uniref:NUDIX hydrolase n=1 Tax=Sphingorhabdus arenilitoris TaxID=1490041 RepID=A0ABV8RFX6_9SPHN
MTSDQNERVSERGGGSENPLAVPAATMVIMHRDPAGGAPKILMMERVKSMAFAGGAAVFPGGKVDQADFDFAAALPRDVTLGLDVPEVAARLAVIRETIEEAGLALGLHGVEDPANCDEARRALHDGEILGEVLSAQGWTPDLQKLVPWARWRPPTFERVSRVFDTRFYLVDAGGAQLNAVVDATENKRLFWASAAETLRLADEGKVKIIFPTRRNLERLAQFDSFDRAAAHAAEYPVETVLTFIDERPDGRYLCIEGRHGYPVTEEALDTALRG